MENNTSRTGLVLGAAVLAGTLIGGLAQAQAPAGGAPAAGAAPAPPPPTPRMPDGHPDLTGLWAAGGPVGLSNGVGNFASGSDEQVFAGRGGNFVGFEADGGLFRTTVTNRNLPIYKPEHWDKIIEAEYQGVFEDPQNWCMPPGVPRMGAPNQIFAMPNMPYVILMYNGSFAREMYRIIPTDGRPHDQARVAVETWNGDPVGRWEGDTLVIETIGFTDASWLHKNGYIHGFELKVTERITRPNLNQLRWEATVEDPEYLVQPWVLDPVVRALNPDPRAVIVEVFPCLELDRQLTTSHTRSG